MRITNISKNFINLTYKYRPLFLVVFTFSPPLSHHTTAIFQIRGKEIYLYLETKAYMAELTKKQEDFCNYYLETGNASEAYRRAYSCAKMTSNSIRTNASRLLADAKIASRVKELQGELKKRSDISKDEVVQSLANIARANILDYICIEDPSEISNLSEQSLTIRDLATLTLAQQQCIKSITTAKGGLKIELYDRITAIDRLFKILGWDSSTPLEQKADLVARIIIGEIETEKKYFASNEHDVK